jgi:peptide-methionine (R)-S-oxide reductase
MTDEYRKNPEAVAQLNQRQFAVTQQAATEPAFDNEFWDKKEAGIYVDIVSGEPLFASTKKFDSGCGWPSFTVPLEPDNVLEKTDQSLGMSRTEVRSSHGDSHLGHVFNDGPAEEGVCGTASIRPPCGSCRTKISRLKAMESTRGSSTSPSTRRRLPND